MEYDKMRQKLIRLFDWDKLESAPGEWGFYNGDDREIRRVGCAVNLTPETIEAAGKLVVRSLNSCAYSTCYPRQVHACEASRSAHYAVASQTHT